MKVKLEMTCDNAAFGEPNSSEYCQEVARILREAANKFEAGYSDFPLRDLNGNRVGASRLVMDGEG